MSNDPEFNQQSGRLGDFMIRSDGFTDSGDSMGISSFLSTADDVRFWAGATYETRATAPFRITRAGLLYATGATISGTITSTSGTIGGFTIGATSLTAGTGNAHIDLSSLGLSSFGEDAAGKYYVQVSSGYSGSGGSFQSKYDQKKLVVIDTHSSGTARGEIALYDASETRNVFISGGGSVTSIYFQNTPMAVASLPSASLISGTRAFVTDAVSTLTAGIGAVVVGGGANVSPVYSDGTNWRQG